ncbi:maker197 [Drosophila busckii]|uniref:Maker197 n=1 Tax=Drosophila busckii TaxID=30019 RepID=A0A0M5J4U7_DROBS|nr:maker197 [Drosophila busckii]
MTNAKRHELYIKTNIWVEPNDVVPLYAHYDDFKIAGEEDQYRLLSLGKWSGTLDDMLSYHLNMNFTTYDRDNDDWAEGNCAAKRHGGWWYTGKNYNCGKTAKAAQQSPASLSRRWRLTCRAFDVGAVC